VNLQPSRIAPGADLLRQRTTQLRLRHEIPSIHSAGHSPIRFVTKSRQNGKALEPGSICRAKSRGATFRPLRQVGIDFCAPQRGPTPSPPPFLSRISFQRGCSSTLANDIILKSLGRPPVWGRYSMHLLDSNIVAQEETSGAVKRFSAFLQTLSFQRSCLLVSCKSIILWRLASILAKARFETPDGVAKRRQPCSAQNSSMFYFTARVKLLVPNGEIPRSSSTLLTGESSSCW
jgi:hypothetical protein